MTHAVSHCDAGVQTDFVLKEEGIDEVTTRISLEILREYANSSIHKLLEGESDFVPRQLIHAKMYTDINKKDEEGNTYLHLAAKRGFDEVVSLLIRRGADLDAKNKQAQTPLSLACANDRVEIAKTLLESGAKCGDDFSCIRRKKELLKLLDVNFRDENGETPLFYAIGNGDLALIDLFLSKGADIEAKNKYGATPIFAATTSTCLKHLVAQGADINVKNAKGYTPFHHFLIWGRDGCVQFLLERGVDINTKTDGGESPLLYCVRTDSYLLDLLIEKGADAQNEVSIVDHIDMKHQAWGRSTLQLLIQAGLDVNIKTKEGDSLLYKACKAFLERFGAYCYDFEVDRRKDELQNLQETIAALLAANARVSERELELMTCPYLDFSSKRAVYDRLQEAYQKQKKEKQRELDCLTPGVKALKRD